MSCQTGITSIMPVAIPLPVLDALHRPLRDLRISVTDRCSFRCTYCMPKEVFGRDFAFLPSGQLLSFEEITRLARIFLELGVEKIRLTGGEPLLRRDLEILVGQLASLPGLRDLTLTTNGAMLARKAQMLKEAGLNRVTVSLDSLDDAVFQAMNDVAFPVGHVLDGIAAAQEVGLTPVKINMVVQRGVNDGDIVPMAQKFHHSGCTLRLIEYMDVGATNGWRLYRCCSRRRNLPAHSMPFIPLEAVGTAIIPEKSPGAFDMPTAAARSACDRLCHPPLLRRLHPRSPVRRREIIYLSVRRRRL